MDSQSSAEALATVLVHTVLQLVLRAFLLEAALRQVLDAGPPAAPILLRWEHRTAKKAARGTHRHGMVCETQFQNRLTWVLGGLALLLVVPTYVYVDRVYSHQLAADRSQSLQDLANAMARTLAENLRERQREITLLAQTSLFRNADFSDPDLRASIERLQASYIYYSWIGFADTQGVVRASTQNLLLGADVSQRPWFNAGRIDNFVGDVHSALLLAKLLPQETGAGPVRFIDFASPVRDRNGAVRGVLTAHAHWHWATKVVQAIAPQARIRDGVEIFLVNKDNTIHYPEALAGKVQLP
jgi:hypothetical protein